MTRATHGQDFMYDLADARSRARRHHLRRQAALRPSHRLHQQPTLWPPRAMRAPHGSVYFADEQTAGRGRGDHAWHSLPARPLRQRSAASADSGRAALRLLPLVAGLAAADAIHAVTGLAPAPGLDIDLRWPNDLLIGPRKTGGILVEAAKRLRRAARRSAQWWSASASTCISALSAGSGHARHVARSGGWTAHIARQALLIALLKSLQQRELSLWRSGRGKSSSSARRKGVDMDARPQS